MYVYREICLCLYICACMQKYQMYAFISLHTMYVMCKYKANLSAMCSMYFQAWLKCRHHDVTEGGLLTNYCTENSHFSQIHQANSHSFVKPDEI